MIIYTKPLLKIYVLRLPRVAVCLLRLPVFLFMPSSDRPTQTACLAVAEPGDLWLTRWVKEDEANPVIDTARRSVGTDLPEMRDHSVWREDGRWYQVMGSGSDTYRMAHK